MKRAFLVQKVKSVSDAAHSLDKTDATVESCDQQAALGVKRRARTSAAMIGLALSMGASGLLLPRQSDKATAAEPQTTTAATTSTPQSTGATGSTISVVAVDHIVSRGQTLRQLAQRYQLSVEVIAAANDLRPDASLKAGQTLKIPVSTASKPTPSAERKASTTFQPIAATGSSRVSTVAQPTPVQGRSSAVRVERDQALARLRQEQLRLRDSLAGLRTKDESSSLISVLPQSQSRVAVRPTPSASQVGPSVALPSVVPVAQVNPESSAAVPQRTTSAYQVRPADRLAGFSGQQPSPQPLTLITSDFSNPDWLKNSQFATVASNPPANSSNPTTLPSALISQQPPAQVVAAQSAESSSADPTLYRVGPGDTLARIARRHHVSPAALISTNRISDPNFIFVGQVLRVPASQPSPSVPARESTSTASEAADKQAENSSQQVVAASVGGAAPTPVANNASQPAAPTPARNSPDTNSLQSNRYVENLLSEIRAMRDRHRNQANAPAERRTNQPAQTVAASPTARTTPAPVSLPAVRSTNPTFNPSRLDAAESAVNRNRPASRSEASRPTNTPARPGNRVAAAPAGSESYAPLLQPITGRMVSPDLPPLGGEDAYLPDGKPAFNGYIWPARGVFTSGFGWRWGRMHQGIDIAADVGTPIYAAADGVVESSGWNSGGYGNLVEIRHGDGSLTRYAHLDHSLVQKGQQVKQGEQIAEMGSTGYSTGPHLHFEVHLPGDEVVNPIAYLPQQQASGN